MTQLVIEPLDPKKHDRAAFSCGIGQVDNYLRSTAKKLSAAGNVRFFVLVDEDANNLIGFYAINSHAIECVGLPKKFARNAPRNGSIPAVYISMIGVDSRFQRQGYGGVLLVDALKTIARAADLVGITVVLLDIVDDDHAEDRLRLYQGYGFQSLPSQPLRMFLPVATVRQLMAD